MSEPLTLAEAVPLGTVHLQRLLAAAGIRSLAIKEPAFVELGVRKPRRNDIDLLDGLRHSLFPVTLVLHHHFSGLLADDAFELLWQRRGAVAPAQ